MSCNDDIIINSDFDILTDFGFVPFYGIQNIGETRMLKFIFDDSTNIRVSNTHRFMTLGRVAVSANEINIGDILIGSPDKIVVDIIDDGFGVAYDIINSVGHTYISNGVLSHNCQFISSERLLVNSLVLANLTKDIENLKPIRSVNGTDFWKPLNKGDAYIIGVDPSTGSGDDYSVITAYDLKTLTQVCEFRSNSTDTPELYSIFKNIVYLFIDAGCDVYFSIENNGVGEGIIALHMGDPTFPDNAIMISSRRSNRLGLTTTAKNKMGSCVKLRDYIESGSLKISSIYLLNELKSFVRHSGSYAAAAGSKDDCISATLIAIRVLDEISSFEKLAYDKIYTYDFDKWESNGDNIEYSDDRNEY